MHKIKIALTIHFCSMSETYKPDCLAIAEKSASALEIDSTPIFPRTDLRSTVTWTSNLGSQTLTTMGVRLLNCPAKSSLNIFKTIA